MPVNNLEAAIEAILFVTLEPISTSQLTKLLKTNEESVDKALAKLAKSLDRRGIRLLSDNNHHQLVSAPQYSKIIEPLVEQSAPSLSAANLEVLTIIAYRQPIAKSQIEKLRGVASDQTIKNLLAKKLIAEKKDRSRPLEPITYITTIDFLRQIGLSSVHDLKEYLENEFQSNRN